MTLFDLDQRKDTLGIHAHVLNGTLHPFTCRITVRQQQPHDYALALQCSCGSAEPCAHSAATLMQAVAQNQSPVPLLMDAPDPIRLHVDMDMPASENPPPRVVLHLRRERIDDPGRRLGEQWVGVVRVLFEYDGVRLPPAVMYATAGSAVQRQRGYESDVLDQLRAFNLVPASEVIGLYASDLRLARFAPEDYVLARGGSKPASPEHLGNILPRLMAAGFALDSGDDFPIELVAPPQDWHLDVRAKSGAWFDVRLGVTVSGQRIDLVPILRGILNEPEFPFEAAPNERDDATWLVALDDRRRVELPVKRLRAMIEPLLEWLVQPREHPSARKDDEDGLPLRMRLPQVAILDELPLRATGVETLRARLSTLGTSADSVDAAEGFGATLRPYQKQGLAWLKFLADSGLGGILADDMGLGKTVQVLAHIWNERKSGRLTKPVLIVVPTSLVANWRNEARRFVPDLKLLVLHGADRHELFAQIDHTDLVITTYPLLSRDHAHLKRRFFGLLVMDEAQTIKNAHTQAAVVVRQLFAERRLAMTGTPVENHLGELWAQIDAVEPGLLGTERGFATLYRTPIEKRGDAARQQRLNRRVAPLILRRRKIDVAPDLPPRTEIIRSIDLGNTQRDLYEALRAAQETRVQSAVSARGLHQAGIVVLDALLKLRQACCDPRLVKLDGAAAVRESAKLEHLLELLDELIAEEHRVLVFSQFTEMLDLISATLRARNIEHLMLTGATQDRGALVDRFQNGQVPVFLISLKAGGTGLNLTAADTVIHYDPWWNPAVEDQASDRAHRIGQQKPVFVYKLICSDTVEEKIQALQARKAALAQALLDGGTSQQAGFSVEDMQALLSAI
ncbi:DEAD/DEAH box helicase [Sinimarinibacterium sp. NLF-5-8]|uniref:DEAD/DEAH box helicase n=1 Tax=Sinimarinibacterium sp. NLF-5-8 TaxID=2698684 RepID=UPI001EE3DE62|nr:DEAD/DEAH box helicase [Sinimarinibacterium sp. NLF-5-8]